MATNGMRAIHPGEILKEEFLLPLQMSPNALSKALHVPASRINDIVLGRRGVPTDTALRLARYFGGDAESWLRLQQAYDLKVTAKIVAKVIQKEITPLTEQQINIANVRFQLAA